MKSIEELSESIANLLNQTTLGRSIIETRKPDANLSDLLSDEEKDTLLIQMSSLIEDYFEVSALRSAELSKLSDKLEQTKRDLKYRDEMWYEQCNQAACLKKALASLIEVVNNE